MNKYPKSHNLKNLFSLRVQKVVLCRCYNGMVQNKLQHIQYPSVLNSDPVNSLLYKVEKITDQEYFRASTFSHKHNEQ